MTESAVRLPFRHPNGTSFAYSNVACLVTEKKRRITIDLRGRALRIADPKFFASLPGFQFFKNNLLDVVLKRSGNLAEKRLDTAGLTFDVQFHTSVTQVLHITRNGETSCDGCDYVAKADTLHAAPIVQPATNRL